MHCKHLTHLLATIITLFTFVALTGCADKPITRQSVYVSCAAGRALMVYEMDSATGDVTQVQKLDLPGRGGALALSPDETTLYAVLHEPPAIVALARDPNTGTLTAAEPVPVHAKPAYIDIDATGNYSITASYSEASVQTFAINDDRSIDPTPVQKTLTAPTAHACLIDPTNRFVYVPHVRPNDIYQFRFQDHNGKLEPVGTIALRGAGTPAQPAGPRHYAYHPTLDTVYFVNELGSSVSGYLMDQKTGELQRFQTLSALPPNWRGRNTGADIHITPDGRFLYASMRGHNTITGFEIDRYGQLTLIDYFKADEVPRAFAIDLNGKYLFAAGLRTHTLTQYAIHPETGRLSRLNTYDTPDNPRWVTTAGLVD